MNSRVEILERKEKPNFEDKEPKTRKDTRHPLKGVKESYR
jgi:hypothetical protein